MAKKVKRINGQFVPRQYMEMAIDVMNKSIDEPRTDGKVSPKVGAVIVLPDGKIDSAFRGELREGDHAEFTLLERKHRADNLKGSKLFATLEPCAPGARKHPKLGCAERIINARIAEVWIGIADPDPNVDRKGIQYLKQKGVVVKMFDQDLQQLIRKANKEFINQALDRADGIEPKLPTALNSLETIINSAESSWYDQRAIDLYLKLSKRRFSANSQEFWKHFESIGIVKSAVLNSKTSYKPTGAGILLFGKDPRSFFPNATVKTKVLQGRETIDQQDFSEALVLLPGIIEDWLKRTLHAGISRESFQRKGLTYFPVEPLREAIINAIVHRDYDIKGAKTQIEINKYAIIVRSAGLPVDPITFDDIRSFRAPSLSRNPIITYVFNKMGFMEEAELGMETFRGMLDKHKVPLPEFTYKAPYLSLMFIRSMDGLRGANARPQLKALTVEEIRGYEIIKSKMEISAKDYATQLGITSRTASRHLAKMLKQKLIETNGESINSPKMRYRIK